MTPTRGRWLNESNGYEVVINESLLPRRRFGDEDPVGRSIRLVVSGDHDIPVVGVVKDVRETADLPAACGFMPPAETLSPEYQHPVGSGWSAIRGGLTGLVRRVIYEAKSPASSYTR